MTESIWDQCQEAKRFIRDRVGEFEPQVAVILGSGLGGFADRIQVKAVIPYTEIPHFKPCKVEGHAGNLVFGDLGGRPIVCQQGRFHCYEGHTPEEVVLPVRVMAALGAPILLVTNAAGGINEAFDVGDIVAIRDQINFSGSNPLRGPNDARLGPRFPDMSKAYDDALTELMHRSANHSQVFLRDGVYVGVSGPSYETPAEIRMFRAWGADMVGMSTVAEVIAANHCGMRVVGLSCVANAAAGISEETLDHEDVKTAVGRVEDRVERMVVAWIKALP